MIVVLAEGVLQIITYDRSLGWRKSNRVIRENIHGGRIRCLIWVKSESIQLVRFRSGLKSIMSFDLIILLNVLILTFLLNSIELRNIDQCLV